MAVSYVLNPLRVRRGDVFWFQLGPQQALEVGNVPLIAALEEGGGVKTPVSVRALVAHLGHVFPTTRERECRSAVDALIDQGILVTAANARAVPKRMLAPTLRPVLDALDRERRMSYGSRRLARGKLELAPSIFNPLPVDRRVFYSALLIAAAERNYDYFLRYESPRRLKVTVSTGTMEAEFDSRFRYVPEDPRAEDLAETKAYANYLCRLAGLPVPRQQTCPTVSEACRSASSLGYPVVLKPSRGHDGIDVHPYIESEAHLRSLLRRLLPKWSRRGGMVVEQHVLGNRYRFTVVGSEIVEVRAAYAPSVTGDGRTSLRELVRRENRRRQSSFSREDGGAGIRIDARVRERLRRRGLTPRSVLPHGETLQLHYTLNRSAGVRSRALALDEVHSHVQAMAVRAVRLFGLHVGGVDYIAPTVGASPRDCGGKICEVQAHPAIIPGDLDYVEFVGKVLDHAVVRSSLP